MGYKEKKARLRELVKQEEAQRVQRIQQEGHQFKHTDAFRVKEKQYRAYQHVHTDFTTLTSLQTLQRVHLEGYETMQIYQIAEPQGAFLVKGFMDQETQMQIGFEALNHFIRKPYRTNLDGTNGLYLEQQAGKEEEKEGKEEAKEDEKKEKGETEIKQKEGTLAKEEEEAA